jgi:NAD(P)-dependent dehydrogenase (short-subunit alcohol dehydrogenase family)
MLDVNLVALARLVELFLDDLRTANPGSAIVGFSSIDALLGHAVTPGYAAAKAGVIGMVRAWAAGLGPEGIRVNAICPGYTETPMIAQGLSVPGLREYWENTSALGRLGQPDDIAKVVRFLLSSDAGFITGQAIVVDGGVTAVDLPERVLAPKG